MKLSENQQPSIMLSASPPSPHHELSAASKDAPRRPVHIETIPAETRLQIYERYMDIADLSPRLLVGKANPFRLIARNVGLNTRDGLVQVSKQIRKELIAFVGSKNCLYICRSNRYQLLPTLQLHKCIPSDWLGSIRRLGLADWDLSCYMTPDDHTCLPMLETVQLPSHSLSFKNLNCLTLLPFTKSTFQAAGGFAKLEALCKALFLSSTDIFSYMSKIGSQAELSRVFRVGAFNLSTAYVSDSSEDQDELDHVREIQPQYGMVLVSPPSLHPILQEPELMARY